MLVNPNITRARVVLEIAAELVSGADQEFQQARVQLRAQGQKDWPHCFISLSTTEGLAAVVEGEAELAMINPAAALTLALRGSAPFDTPHPVRTIAVIPSLDQLVFAVKAEIGLERFEDIVLRRPPLRVALRGHPGHCLHFMLDGIAAATGFRLDDVRAWGGALVHQGAGPPLPGGPTFQALARGEIDAIFDEASQVWLDAALDAGMRILSLAESTVRRLEALGYRRAVLAQSTFPRLPGDILTIDFSGWPIFVHAQAPDSLVALICAALDARKHLIPWEHPGPLPVERMCREAPDTPQDVPLHSAAERFWRERGYL